jgi:YfiH family protein
MNAKRYPLELQEKDGIWYLTSPNLRQEYGIVVAFTSRRKGVSGPPYSSLNLSFRVGDDSSRVSTNRQRLLAALGLDPDSWVLAEQVHGLEIAQVGKEDLGRATGKEGIALVDGLLTQTRGLTLAVLCADCVPLVLVHPSTRTVGIAHAGWKGTLGGMGQKLVGLMRLRGVDPNQILAFIGPAIGPCCYEVDPERIESFRRKFGQAVTQENYLDLADLMMMQLESEGVSQRLIESAGMCTSCHRDDFYSFRASGGATGRQAGLVTLLW